MSAPRVVAVVQARLGSTRLPGKALAEVAGRPVLAHVVERARAIPGVDALVLAIPDGARDDALAAWADGAGLPCVRGSERDVLDRFHDALARHPADALVRITADCPLLDPEVSGRVVAAWRRRWRELDYASNVHPPTFPDGLDTEVIARDALEAAWREARDAPDREHVTPFVWRQPGRFRLANVANGEDLSGQRWTLDTAPDLDFVRAVHEHLPLAPDAARRFAMGGVLAALAAEPALRARAAGERPGPGRKRSAGLERRHGEGAAR